MQALILAAGMGRRLGYFTKENTKCMLKVNGRTLIEQSLDNLCHVGISRCIMVVGYHQQKVKDLLGTQYKNIKIVYVENPVYNTTNNIYSLFLAKEYLIKEDTLLLEGDLIYDVSLLQILLDNPQRNLALVDKYQLWMSGTVVKLDSENNIVSFIPKKFFEFKDIECYYKTVNIYKFSKEFSKNSYVPFLEAYSKAFGNNEYYEQVLRIITFLETQELKALRLEPKQKWYEIDDVQDKDIAELVFAPSTEIKLERMNQRYGGYWRFPRLKDFCYLVNPYFPSVRMKHEMQAYFFDLMTQYPSGLSVQNFLAAKMFDVAQSDILVGNGASELIRGISRVLKGACGIVFPSFTEYAESFGENRVVSLVPDNDQFLYTADDIIAFSEKSDSVLLINPDNPSGNFIHKEEVIRIADELQNNGKRLILDESFVDFSSDCEANSLIEPDIINKYSNLVIIKSISKSYGVPGLRLGVLVTSDAELMSSAKKEIPIWNINSLCEYFLQIIGKYQNDYQLACEEIGRERDRFGNELREISFLRVIPSQSNYFMCEIINKYSSEELASLLLERHEVLIKDLKGKKGVGDRNFVRISVRSTEDNNCLIECLKKIEAQ